MKGQLDPVAFSRDDDPRAVRVVGVPVREPRALDGAVGTLHQASAVLTWRIKHAETAREHTAPRQPRLLSINDRTGRFLR